ncbi:hypothetical protein EVAR_100733_1, partial [Eumeta japonica]
MEAEKRGPRFLPREITHDRPVYLPDPCQISSGAEASPPRPPARPPPAASPGTPLSRGEAHLRALMRFSLGIT